MASVKVILWKADRKKDGSHPIAIRITKDRKSRYIFTGFYVLEKDWDNKNHRVKKGHPNSARLNNFLLKKLAEANDKSLEADTENEHITSKEIKNKIKQTGRNITFFQLANNRIQEYKKKGTFSVASADQGKINNLRKFHGSDDLYFQDINNTFIEKFKIYSSAQGKSQRTIANHLILIRTLFNRAIKEGIVSQKYYPFAGDNVKIKIGSGLKIGLSSDEVKRIENLTLNKNTTIWHTKNIWLFSFYLAGIRISDVLQLKWSDFKDGRLFYVMNKNEKAISLKLPDKAHQILNQYRKPTQSSNNFVFPFLQGEYQKSNKEMYTKRCNAARLFNKYLKRIATQAGIDKNLSNHIARHSFGNIAGDKIHPLMLQKLYRHSDLKTTINYQANFIHKEADEALDNVLSF